MNGSDISKIINRDFKPYPIQFIPHDIMLLTKITSEMGNKHVHLF